MLNDEGWRMVKKRFVRILLIMLICQLATACSVATSASGMTPALLGIEGATVVGTGKSLTDHYMSFTTGKNCSTLRKNTGRTYCEEDEISAPEEIYCYKSLGKVNCYSTPRPHGEDQNRVGHIAQGAKETR